MLVGKYSVYWIVTQGINGEIILDEGEETFNNKTKWTKFFKEKKLEILNSYEMRERGTVKNEHGIVGKECYFMEWEYEFLDKNEIYHNVVITMS